MNNINTVFLKLTLLCLCLFMVGCATTQKIGMKIDSNNITDGTYTGSFKGGPNYAEVKIVIENAKITNVLILEHDTWKGKKAEPIIPSRIIEEQSTDVDAVTGATNSSNVIMNAVQKAVEKSYKND